MNNTIITEGESAAILADNKRLRAELAEAQAAATMWRAGADNMARECERLKAVLQASNLAVVMMGESLAESRKLVAELEAARKVADAAVKWHEAYNDVSAYPPAFYALVDAVREYRALAAPLSPGKREVIDAAIEKLDEIA